MPTPLEQYRAWERTGPFVHVMQLERGDGAARWRLTLTDRPYFDRGVAGVRYHHTFPAPIHCIISDITSDESMTGTTFGDVVLSNGSGLLDDVVAGFPNIIGQPFTILRGSPEWSLLETEFPKRWLPVMRGQVEGVLVRNGGAEIVLQLSPKRYQLDRPIGSPTEPVLLGRCRNVPGLLVDAATLRYRFATNPCHDYMLEVRDAGDPLTPITDYTLVLEDGEWKGQIELASPLSGDLTADLRSAHPRTGYRYPVAPLVNYLLYTVVAPVAMAASSLDLSSQLINAAGDTGVAAAKAWFCFSADGSKLYAMDTDSGGTCYQWTTADPIAGATYDSKSFGLGNPNARGLRVSSDGGRVYWSANGAVLYARPLSTPGDISTAGSVAMQLLLSAGWPAAATVAIQDILVSPDESVLWVLTLQGIIGMYTMGTPGDVTTVAYAGEADLYPLIDQAAPGLCIAMDLSSDGKRLYILDDNYEVHQIDLITPWDLSERVRAGRKFHYPHSAAACFRIHPAGDRLFVLTRTEQLEQHYLAEVNTLPESLIAWPGALGGGVTDNTVAEYVATEMPVGEVITSLLSNIQASYYVSRLGELRMCRYLNPFTRPSERHEQLEWLQIAQADCLGGAATFVEHVQAHRAVQHVTVTYDVNWFVQDRSSLAAVVDEEDAAYYGTPYLTTTDEVADEHYPVPESRLIETRTATKADADQLVAAELDLWSIERNEYQVTTTLAATPLYDVLSVGGLLIFRGGLIHPAFRPEPFLAIYDLVGDDHIASADSALNSFSGDFRIRVKMQAITWSGARGYIVCKDGSSSSERAWGLRLGPSNELVLDLSANGSAVVSLSTAVHLDALFRLEQPFWLQVVADLDNGSSQRAMHVQYCFEPGLDLPPDDAWIALESVTASGVVSSLFDSSAPVTIGSRANNTGALTGVRIHRVVVDTDNTIRVDWDARRYRGSSPVGSSIEGETWDLKGNPVYPGDPRVLLTGRQVNWSRGYQQLRVFK